MILEHCCKLMLAYIAYISFINADVVDYYFHVGHDDCVNIFKDIF